MLLDVVTIRRNKIEISDEILSAAIEGAKKTNIVHSSKLDFKIASKYIELLMKKGFLEQHENLYLTTEKGKKLRDKIKKLNL